MTRYMASISAAATVCAILAGAALAQQPPPLKIGVLSDFSSVYSDIGGMGNVGQFVFDGPTPPPHGPPPCYGAPICLPGL